MGNLASHHSGNTTKLLLIGDPGSGKTGAMASLVNDLGLELFVQDYDNGLDVLRSFVKPENYPKVHYVTLTDKIKPGKAGYARTIGAPEAYSTGQRLMDKWIDPDTGEDFGSIWDWGPDRVLVIDSLTFQGAAAMRYVMYMNKQVDKRPRPRDWGFAIDMQEATLGSLFSKDIKCHVIVTAHLRLLEPREEMDDADSDVLGLGGVPDDTKLKTAKASSSASTAVGIYPSALGRALPPKVGSYFNSVLRVRTKGNRKVIETRSSDGVELKNPAPILVPPELDLEHGLAKFFTIVQKGTQK